MIIVKIGLSINNEQHAQLSIAAHIFRTCHGAFLILKQNKLECGLMPNVMAALPNKGGALC